MISIFFLCWRLGHKLGSPSACEHIKKTTVLRGLPDDNALLDEAINFPKTISKTFKEDNYRPAKLLQEGSWGKCMRIFFDNFYAEAWEIKKGHVYERAPTDKPIAGLIWCGNGTINDNQYSSDNEKCSEFLIVPNTPIHIVAVSESSIYLFWPLLSP